MVLLSPVFRSDTGRPVQLSKALPPQQSEETIIVNNAFLRKIDNLINITDDNSDERSSMEHKVIDMERSNHPNAFLARQKLEEARGYQKRLELFYGSSISKKTAVLLIKRITALDMEIIELSRAVPEEGGVNWANVAPHLRPYAKKYETEIAAWQREVRSLSNPTSEEKRVRIFSIEKQVENGSLENFHVLIGALFDSDANVRSRAVMAFSGMPVQLNTYQRHKAADALSVLALNDSNPNLTSLFSLLNGSDSDRKTLVGILILVLNKKNIADPGDENVIVQVIYSIKSYAKSMDDEQAAIVVAHLENFIRTYQPPVETAAGNPVNLKENDPRVFAINSLISIGREHPVAITKGVVETVRGLNSENKSLMQARAEFLIEFGDVTDEIPLIARYDSTLTNAELVGRYRSVEEMSSERKALFKDHRLKAAIRAVEFFGKYKDYQWKQEDLDKILIQLFILLSQDLEYGSGVLVYRSGNEYEFIAAKGRIPSEADLEILSKIKKMMPSQIYDLLLYREKLIKKHGFLPGTKEYWEGSGNVQGLEQMILEISKSSSLDPVPAVAV